jgi:leucyl aminopeptidase
MKDSEHISVRLGGQGPLWHGAAVPTTPRLTAAPDLAHAGGDALVLLLPTPFARFVDRLALPPVIAQGVRAALAADRALAEGDAPPCVLPLEGAPGGRLVLAPVGHLEDEVEDVRRLAEAALSATSRAVLAGARSVVLALWVPEDPRFSRAHEVAALGALGAAWRPPGARAVAGLEAVTVVGLTERARTWVEAVEGGRNLCRDLIVGGPEELNPPAAAAQCEAAFAGSGVKVTTLRDLGGFPLLAAVGRASATVERHAPRVTTLELRPAGAVQRTLFIAGKGITYDTGGADLKTGGGMAGMSRDKGGAAAAAGLMKTLDALAIPGLHVVAMLGWVRNSVGEEAYVSDEIIPARSGVRVRIGNTDAEGRLVLADLLCALRERALAEKAPFPTLFTLATLTGHSYRAFGPCVAALENTAARGTNWLSTLQEAGEQVGEPFEFSRPRREDYLFCAPKSPAEDLVSSNRLASVDTPRGHQGPFAFLDVASGIRGSGLPFAHLDISGVALSPADWAAGRPTGAPVAALAALAALAAHAPRS